MYIYVEVNMGDKYYDNWKTIKVYVSEEEIVKMVDKYFDMRMEQVKNEPRFIHHD